MQALILAGGEGTRLKPFTNVIPKPLVPIGDLPILEVVLRQLKYHGADRIVLAVNKLARLIEAFFGDGSRLGLKIVYSLEDKPLGTAGPIRLADNLDEDFIVMNGDLLTTIDYSAFFQRHRTSGATATIATFQKEVKIDLGVLEMREESFANYVEKPIYHFTVSMGIYALNRRVIQFIDSGKKFDMPDLVLALHKAGEKILCYSGDYEWLDIGRIDDYEKAVQLFEANKDKYLVGGELSEVKRGSK
ncbi:MAG TPA: sugar phosphate nucleotidyltransferase [Terriglobales bacterium]